MSFFFVCSYITIRQTEKMVSCFFCGRLYWRQRFSIKMWCNMTFIGHFIYPKCFWPDIFACLLNDDNKIDIMWCCSTVGFLVILDGQNLIRLHTHKQPNGPQKLCWHLSARLIVLHEKISYSMGYVVKRPVSFIKWYWISFYVVYLG